MKRTRNLFVLLLSCLPLSWSQPKIETAKVVAQTPNRTAKIPGELQPYETVELHARVTGYVEKVLVDVGSQVRPGALLVQLSAPEMTAQLAEARSRVEAAKAQKAEAEARLASTQATYDRLKAASATPGAIAGNELVTAKASVDAAQAVVSSQQAAVEAATAAEASTRALQAYLRITAPFAGTVTARYAHPGALAKEDTPLLKLEQTQRLRLIVALPEALSATARTGSRVVFTVPAYPGQEFHGTVARLPRSVDAKTRTMPVELDVANSDQRLAPGMYPELLWPSQPLKPVLLVPATAVVTNTEHTFVIRDRNGAAEYVNVTKGPASGDLVEVRSPLLREGDTVVKRATDELREGTRLANR